jgi:hypothetical protein
LPSTVGSGFAARGHSLNRVYHVGSSACFGQYWGLSSSDLGYARPCGLENRRPIPAGLPSFSEVDLRLNRTGTGLRRTRSQRVPGSGVSGWSAIPEPPSTVNSNRPSSTRDNSAEGTAESRPADVGCSPRTDQHPAPVNAAHRLSSGSLSGSWPTCPPRQAQDTPVIIRVRRVTVALVPSWTAPHRRGELVPTPFS